MSSNPTIRNAQSIIDSAICENRNWELLCFFLTISFTLVGFGVLIAGVFQGNGLISIAGALGASLFLPTLRAAMTIRRENIGIRLLEIVLTNAKTEKLAAEAIRDYLLPSRVKETKSS